MYICEVVLEVLHCVEHPGALVGMESGSTMHRLYVIPETPPIQIKRLSRKNTEESRKTIQGVLNVDTFFTLKT